MSLLIKVIVSDLGGKKTFFFPPNLNVELLNSLHSVYSVDKTDLSTESLLLQKLFVILSKFSQVLHISDCNVYYNSSTLQLSCTRSHLSKKKTNQLLWRWQMFTCLFCHCRGINRLWINEGWKWTPISSIMGNYSNHYLKTFSLMSSTLLLQPLQSRFVEESPIHRNLLKTSLERNSTHQHFNIKFFYAELIRKI